jgi:Cellulose biosynthesis protein BcsN
VQGSSVTIVSTDLAFASLGPGTPAVLSIIQTEYANATRQAIALATRGTTPGQNVLRVDIFSISNDNAGRENTLSNRPLSDETLTSEAQEALPNVALHRSLTYVQNQYGPFGYAVGRAPQGEMCIYAWQRTATSDVDTSLFNRRATVSVRLRLCQPNATETSLVAAMMGLHINASLSSGSWTQRPNELSPNLGAPGVPMGPSATAAAPDENPTAVRRAAPRRRVPRAAAPPATAAPEPAPAAQPDAGSAIPPPPPAGTVTPGAPAVPVPPPPAQGAQP